MAPRRLRRYSQSGRTRSIPGMWPPGNDRPASMRRARSAISSTAMFRPTSPRPPRNTSLQGSVIEEGLVGEQRGDRPGPGRASRLARSARPHGPRLGPSGRGYPIRVSKIYTRTGDDGTTGLLYGSRISKADPAAEAYGSVDETVADIGMARALTARHEASLPDQFVVPGANPVSAALDVARATCRRAERRTVEVREAGREVNPEAARYLNRLSDLLFALARWQAGGPEEPSRLD